VVELLFTKQAAYFDERGERLLMVVVDDISSGRASLREARATLDGAWATGCRYYDTAPLYGLGLAETRLNGFLRAKPRGAAPHERERAPRVLSRAVIEARHACY